MICSFYNNNVFCSSATGSSDQTSSDFLNPLDKKRQGYIDELIESEERYVEDLQVVLEVKLLNPAGYVTNCGRSLRRARSCDAPLI